MSVNTRVIHRKASLAAQPPKKWKRNPSAVYARMNRKAEHPRMAWVHV